MDTYIHPYIGKRVCVFTSLSDICVSPVHVAISKLSQKMAK